MKTLPPLRWSEPKQPPKPPRRTYNLPRVPCGDRVTVCIGAICETTQTHRRHPKIILCTDTRLSISGFTSFDAGIKISWVSPGILGLMADDPSHAKDLFRQYYEHFVLSGKAEPFTLSNWADELRKPVTQYKLKLIDEYFQRRWGVTYDEYLNGRLNVLPANTLDTIARELDALTLQCQAILAVFPMGTPKLLIVMEDATVVESAPFAVIGSGAWIANAALCHRQYGDFLDLSQALYYVYEAKKLSEAEGHVGKNTHIFVYDGQELSFITPAAIDLLDAWFVKFGPQPLTDAVKIPVSGFWSDNPLRLTETYMPLLDEDAPENGSGTVPSEGS